MNSIQASRTQINVRGFLYDESMTA